jgi:hypothetical protein
MKQGIENRSFKMKLNERFKFVLFLLLTSHFLLLTSSHAEVESGKGNKKRQGP